MYNNSNHALSPLWDLTLPPPLPALDDDFLSLLQKQMAANPIPQTLAPGLATYPQQPQLDGISPPMSQDSSPSPPSNSADHDSQPLNNWATHQRQISRGHDENEHLKRKAPDSDGSDDDESSQPQPKAQHTLKSDSHSGSNTAKKSARRKSGGKDSTDDSRLLKRKEQNRAAQRAFRERKEKHVKDLEDKVAALEARTDTQNAENDNLRELLTRLQKENLSLRQQRSGGASSSFTFTFPPDSSPEPVAGPSSSTSSPPEQNLNLFSHASSSPATSSTRTSPQSFTSNNIFETYASDSSVGLFGSPSPANFTGPNIFQPNPAFTTLASNPLFTSYRDPSPNQWDNWLGGNVANDPTTINPTSLDELFGSGPFEDLTPFSALLPDPVVTPPSNSISPMPEHNPSKCPKTREEFGAVIAASTPSTFGPPLEPSELKPISQAECLAKAKCENLPKTTKSKDHIDLRVAYTHMKQHPSLTEEDIDDLCTELTAKAKCDGTRPVLEKSDVMQVASDFQARSLKKLQQGGQVR
jgi:AP-1-like factor